MSIKTDYSGAGSPALISHLAGASSQALDRLWEQRWIRESMEKGGSRPSLDAESLAGELRYKSDRIVILTSGLAGKMIRAALTAFRDVDDKKEVLCFGESFSAEEYTELLTKIEDRNFSIICVGLEEEPATQMAAYGTLRKILQDKYGRQGADRRTVIVASPAARHLSQENLEGFCALPEDTSPVYASNTDALLIPLMAAGVSGEEYLQGFHEMVISTWWDADADQYSLHLSRYGAEDILYWQTELSGLADWLAGMHRTCGIDARPLFCPAELPLRRMKGGTDDLSFRQMKRGTDDQISIDDLLPRRMSGTDDLSLRQMSGTDDQISIDDLLGPQPAFATQLLVEREKTDIMLPSFPGVIGGGSLNELLQTQAKNVLSPSLLERMKKGTAQDICGIRMTEITPYEYGQMTAFLQISCGITQYAREAF